MTYDTGTAQPSDDDQRSTAQAARDETADVARGAVDGGQHLASEAKAQAKDVAREARGQANDVLAQGRAQLVEQADQQQKRVASGLHGFSAELGAMAEGSQEGGVATDLTRQLADRTDAVASWLEEREPGALLEEVTSFARRRPGTFLAIAAGAGLLAGRLTRGVKDASGSGAQPSVDESRVTAAHRAPGAPSTPVTTSTAGGPAPVTRTPVLPSSQASGGQGAGTSAGDPMAGVEVGERR
ncbi:hypothetical protein [Actinotalea sp. K2]|uniref:hypothetical protein n=1 Tax=Actinotalea sp. K2 TaxID=2939438 RepID=UPI002017FB01|nr:hypothetical protein [Actinotalea sp. K2]MCL3862382.1 hypothetical protein [Actinotalea sp. K2]